MIKQIAWNTFKNTGSIDTMMEILETDKEIKNKEIKEKINGDYKNERNCTGSK